MPSVKCSGLVSVHLFSQYLFNFKMLLRLGLTNTYRRGISFRSFLISVQLK